ncbi:uncharacterized protein LOC143292422 [Babylonia areolata]|uniref:uncharacterized protein LOC143292422 n=1 Tax=Babylonia areolata TaxID=304850 RepID=UPI003FD51433
MSSWVATVFISFGKALLISLSILIGSCCVRFLYRLWIRRMGCYDRSEDTMSESYKYEMELQTDTDMNHHHNTPCHRPAQDAMSEIELPPSPGANTSCPPYNTNALQQQPDCKAPCDDFSDNFSGMWRHDPTSEAGEMTDADLTSVAAETTTMCSVLTATEDPMILRPESPPAVLPPERRSSCSLPRLQSPPSPPRLHGRSPPISEMQSAPLPDLPGPQSPPPEFQEYQCYMEPPLSRRTTPTRQQQRDRGTELFLSQYYKSLEQETGPPNTSPPPPQ